ncbi:hypothetical protein [Streptomyces sp. ATCC 21386]|uniref:hypothetical protein n=1 Tax=Streptomyces sp. ATCC 21386 TaxID=2699428 RepID=UPI001BFF9E75|nr:hypothetical protein [Streptomyces sp. ATCC 21386]
MRDLPPPQPQILEVAGRNSHDLAQHITDHLRVIDQRCGATANEGSSTSVLFPLPNAPFTQTITRISPSPTSPHLA